MYNHELEKLMSKKVVTFKKESKVKEIAKYMSSMSISCVAITEQNKPIGIITERDMIKRIIAQNKETDKLLAVDIMSYPVVTVPEDVGIIAVAQLMKKKGIRRVVVVKKDKIVGIITQTDLLEGMINKIKHLNWQLVHAEISLDEYIASLKKIKVDKAKSRKKLKK